MNNIQDGVYRADLNGNIIWCSPSALKIFGAKSDYEVIGANTKDLYVHLEDRQRILSLLQKNGLVSNFEILMKRTDGKSINISLSSTYWRDEDGKILGTEGVFRDITAQKLSEKALLQSESRFREALRNSNDILYRLNLNENKYDYMSSSVSDISGYSLDEIMEMGPDGVNRLTHPDDLEITTGYRTRLAEFDQSDSVAHTLEYRVRHKDGHYLWLGDSHSLIRDADGTPRFIIGAARDITEQKKTEQALLDSELLNRETIDAIDEAIHVVDIDLKIILMNGTFRKWCRELGLESDVVGKSIYEIFPFLKENVKYEYRQVINTGEVFISEENQIIGNQSIITETKKIPIKENGRVYRIITVIRDITMLRQKEIKQRARIELLDNLRSASDIDSCLHCGCRAILNARIFERAVLTLHDDKKRIINMGYVGLDDEIMRTAREAPPPEDDLLTKLTQDKFRIHNSFFVPYDSGLSFAETARYISQENKAASDNTAWQSGDELFVPIRGENNRYEGWLSVDTPFNRRRPTGDIIEWLEETVDIVTQKICEIRTNERLSQERIALLKSEEKYRNLIDSSPDAISIYQNGRTVMINPAFCNLFGYSLEDMGHDDGFFVMIQDKDRDTIIDRMKDRQQGRQLTNIFPIDLKSKDGRIIPCETTASQIVFSGQPAQLITIRDITERKKIIDALQQSEKFSKAIIEYSPLGISVRSNTGKLLSYNQAWRDIWGFSEEIIIDFTTRERSELKFDRRDDYLSEWLPMLEKIYKEGGYLHIPEIYVCEPWRENSLWITQHFYAIKDSAGNVDRVVILTEDITGQKLAEEAILASEQRYKDIVENSLQAICIIQDGMLVFFNQKFAEILELKLEELQNYDLSDYFSHIADSEVRKQAIYNHQARTASQPVQNHYEFQIRTKTKKLRWVEVFIESCIHNGKPAIQAFMLDITERKMAEEKIKTINEEKLEQAKRIAGAFAHEIRNALFPAAASLNKLKTDSAINNIDVQSINKYSSIAERSITKAADITRLISMYTKLDTELMPEDVILGAVIDELQQQNQLLLNEKQVIMNISGDRDGRVKSNRRQLLMALNNLLINSIDAMVAGRDRQIDISWHRQDNYYIMSFSDNGCGVPDEFIEKVFEPFFSMKSGNENTGLGLPMAKRIIEMYGGNISVSSEPGKGTRFEIKLKSYDTDSPLNG